MGFIIVDSAREVKLPPFDRKTFERLEEIYNTVKGWCNR